MPAIKANKIHFSKVCEFLYDGKHCAAHLGKFPVAELQEHMNALCGESVVMQFNTASQYEKKDVAKFDKRLDLVAGWTFTEWSHPVIDGYVQSFMQCVATRTDGAPRRIDAAIISQIEQKRIQVERMENSSGTGHDLVKMIRLREEIWALQSRLSSPVEECV